jgi:DNA modification methylase
VADGRQRGQGPRLTWRRGPPPTSAGRPLELDERVELAPGPRAGRLILGDNLEALAALRREGVVVDLVYIDPPYMAGSDRALAAPGDPLAYRDTWPGGVDDYLDMLHARLTALRGLVAPTGNVMVHLDRHAVHYARLLLDEVFGAANFRNEIVWRRANAHSDPARFGTITDAILFYAASPRAYWADVHVPYTPEYIASHWRRRDARGAYRLIPLDAPRHGDGGQLVYPWRGKLPAPSRTWAVQRAAMEALEREGKIAYTAAGTPNLRRYLDESPGLRAQNLWDDVPPVNPMAAERLGYPTQKPVALLERIIAATCPPDGLVLDAFAGSGTAAEAAERLGRRWIAIDGNPAAIQLARRRLLALHGQPGRGTPRVEYPRCDRCRHVARRVRASAGPPIAVRPFTLERAAPASIAALPVREGRGDAPVCAGVERAPDTTRVDAPLWAEVERAPDATRVHLRGDTEAIQTWSVDWHHAPPVFAASAHLLRPRRGPLPTTATGPADAGRVAVQVVDPRGEVRRGALED